MKIKRDNMGRPQCPVCGSKNILTKRSGERWCRRCGWSRKKINIQKGGEKRC